MAYSQSKKVSDSEKKLQALKLQLYGKEVSFKSIDSAKQTSNTLKESTNIQSGKTKSSPVEDIGYLKRDLLKTCLLAIIAIGIQIGLFIGLQNGWIKF